mmetsp:Transcript_8707/g.14218  ORF Transcript_8707/g.14218 Transcript_8707/m.14218 type:complete len:241 (-) Transcript_8707:177-899(-)
MHIIARAVARAFRTLVAREVYVIPSAIDRDITWPRMAFLGWLAGAAVKLYCNVINAPKGPNTRLYSGFLFEIASEKYKSINNDKKHPKNVKIDSLVVNGGGGSLLAPVHFLTISISFLLSKIPRRNPFCCIDPLMGEIEITDAVTNCILPDVLSDNVGVLSCLLSCRFLRRKDPPILMEATILFLTLRLTLSLSARLSTRQTCLGPLRATMLPITSAALNRYCSFVGDFSLSKSVFPRAM